MKLRYNRGLIRYGRANENPVPAVVNHWAEASCLPAPAFHVPRRHRKRTCWRGGLFAVVLGLLSSSAARADEIFVTNDNLGGPDTGHGLGTVSEYTTSGATVNPSLISGLSFPDSIAVSGPDLFVANANTSNTIGEYTTSGLQ